MYRVRSVSCLWCKKRLRNASWRETAKESILSISVKVYGTPRPVQKVPARYFSPQPKWIRRSLAITGIASPFKKGPKKKDFLKSLRKGFAHKRKLLKRNLGCPETVLKECGITPKARPEEVLLNQWLCLSKTLAFVVLACAIFFVVTGTCPISCANERRYDYAPRARKRPFVSVARSSARKLPKRRRKGRWVFRQKNARQK